MVNPPGKVPLLLELNIKTFKVVMEYIYMSLTHWHGNVLAELEITSSCLLIFHRYLSSFEPEDPQIRFA